MRDLNAFLGKGSTTRKFRFKRKIIAGAAGLTLAAGAMTSASGTATAASYDFLQNFNSNLCLGNFAGTAYEIQYSCNGSNADQGWTMNQAGSDANGAYYTLNNRANKCLGIYQGSTAGGARAVQWSCNGHDDQHWYVFEGDNAAPSGLAPTWEFQNKGSGDCLGIWQGSVGQGANVIQWSCNNHNDQQWYWG